MLIQFSVTSFLIIVAIAVVVSLILSNRLERNIELLEGHGEAMMAGTTIKVEDSISIPSLRSDVRDLRMITISAVGGGFVILFGALVMIVWRGSKTITNQKLLIEEQATRQVDAVNRLLQDRINVLFNEVMSALSEARSAPAFEISREYHELVEELSDLVGPADNEFHQVSPG